MSRDVVVLSAVRSAIGSFGGGLSSFEPSELGGIVMKEAIARNLVELNKLSGDELVEERYKKFRAMTRCAE